MDRYKVHDIEIVIDRLLVEEKDLQRLRTSINKAMLEGDGLMLLLELEKKEVFKFSKQLMCLETGISYEEPSPNSFSFNSPYGACENCKGLGVEKKPELSKIIPDSTLSVFVGGIKPLGEYKKSITFQLIEDLFKRHKCDIKSPIERLPKALLDIILYGMPENEYVELESGFDDENALKLGFQGMRGYR